jgi:hypothetical protein
MKWGQPPPIGITSSRSLLSMASSSREA